MRQLQLIFIIALFQASALCQINLQNRLIKKTVTIHPCESNINQGLPQTCSEQSRTIAPIPQILIQSILSIIKKQTIEGLYLSVRIGEICGKKAF
jgi:hypothetical protein